MSKRSKYSAEEKLKILLEHKNNYISIVELCRVYEISKYAFYKWKKQYKRYGVKGLEESRTWKSIRRS